MKVAIGAATVLLGFVGGVQVQHLVAASSEPRPPDRAIDPRAHAGDTVPEDCPRVALAPPYPVNEHGMTYGSGAGIDEDDPGPDLVAAHGTDGRCGFVRATDRGQGHDIPLYAQDGVTVIGTFHVSGGS